MSVRSYVADWITNSNMYSITAHNIRNLQCMEYSMAHTICYASKADLFVLDCRLHYNLIILFSRHRLSHHTKNQDRHASRAYRAAAPRTGTTCHLQSDHQTLLTDSGACAWVRACVCLCVQFLHIQKLGSCFFAKSIFSKCVSFVYPIAKNANDF